MNITLKKKKIVAPKTLELMELDTLYDANPPVIRLLRQPKLYSSTNDDSSVKLPLSPMFVVAFKHGEVNKQHIQQNGCIIACCSQRAAAIFISALVQVNSVY